MKNIIVARSSFVILLIENYLFKSKGFEAASAQGISNGIQGEAEESQNTEDN